MKDKDLPIDNNPHSLEELTDQASQIIESLEKCGIEETTLYFEFSFREREPFDSNAIKDIKESVKYWRRYLDEK